MAIYRVQGPDGSIYRIEGPDDATDEQIAAFAASQFGPKPEPPKKDLDSSILDVPVALGRGAVQGVRFIADVFGADIHNARPALRQLLQEHRFPRELSV